MTFVKNNISYCSVCCKPYLYMSPGVEGYDPSIAKSYWKKQCDCVDVLSGEKQDGK